MTMAAKRGTANFNELYYECFTLYQFCKLMFSNNNSNNNI